jgi:ornithine cyclodeaminase/alanine dehydrogenase
VTLVIDAQVAELVLEMPDLVDELERSLLEEAAGSVVMPPRLNLAARDGFLRIMPAIMSDRGLMGFKAFHGSPTAGARYLVAIYDQEQGELLALLDGHFLTAARTGAMAGVAARHLARVDARTVAVIGSGLEARTNLSAVCVGREFEEVRVYSPRPERREQFAADVRDRLKIEVRPVATAEESVADVDVVIVATNTSKAADPIAFRGAWFQPGMHVSSIGSTSPRGREIDAETFARADLFVSDAPAQLGEESGDALDAQAVGVYATPLELSSVVSGVCARADDVQRSLFKSVGTAVQDIVAGFLVYEKARARGLGLDIGEFLDRKPI